MDYKHEFSIEERDSFVSYEESNLVCHSSTSHGDKKQLGGLKNVKTKTFRDDV